MEDATATPGLEVGFAIDTGASLAQLEQLSVMMDSTEARVVADAERIERATGGMLNMGPAQASIKAFGAARDRETQNTLRDSARVEQAGERLFSRLARENAAYGKTRAELRQLKAEEIALAAERVGNSDLARRIREEEADLWGKEAMAARQAAIARGNAAEDAAAAEQRALQAVNAQLIERNRLEAALGRTNGVDRPRATDAGATYSALADRAAEQETVAKNAAAAATERLAREHAELASAVRGSHAAQLADADAAERLRMSTDPLYAATSRLNAEIAESTRLYYAGATAPGEYGRQQEVLTGRLRDVERQHVAVSRGFGTIGETGKLAGYHMQNLAFQFQDLGQGMIAAAGSSAPLKMVMMTMMQQGLQIQGIMSQAGIGIRGVGTAFGEMSKKILLATVTNPYLLALGVTIGLFAGAVALLNRAANEGAPIKKYAEGLGLTAKEMRNLDDLTVTWGDTTKAVFQVAGRNIAEAAQWAGNAIWDYIGPNVTKVWNHVTEWFNWTVGGVKSVANFMIGGFVGAFNAIVKTWSMFPAILGDAFYSAVNTAIGALNGLVQKSLEGLNWLGSQANKILPEGWKIPHLSADGIAEVNNQFKGAGKKFGTTLRDEVSAAQKDYLGDIASGVGGFVGRASKAVVRQTIKNAQGRTLKNATDKGYLDPEKGKTDKTAERLARENEAIEAQIRNLYSLADAYGVSGAAALIAEARVKAESDAIKKRGEIEMFVDRQIRLSIAQRVSDAAKSTAGLREQADAQSRVNAMVVAGHVPAERASEITKNQIADLPLLAAAEAAQQRGLATEAKRATDALAGQRAERERLAAAERHGQFLASSESGNQRLAELREELRLVGETDAARGRALASRKATQEAGNRGFSTEDAAAYIAQQIKIFDITQQITDAQMNFNEALTFTADRWDVIAQNVQSASQGMADAFGSAGRSIGDIAAIYSGFHATRERLDAEHKVQVTRYAGNEEKLLRENQLHALRSATLQVGAYGDMAAAAKGFFREGTGGYQALQRAEQVFRAVEFALSVRAMVQDGAETVSSIAKSGARAAAHAVEAVAKAIASLPFPANLAAGAATAAALAAIGLSIAGSFGGSSRPEPTNTGTGTVLGDTEAKSESIKRSIDALKAVDTVMLGYSRQMASSLRSIESQIGGIASLVVRAGDISASAGVTEGFKPNLIGSVLSKIPLIGGILGGLFGSTTTVTGSGLYAGAQSLGGILNGGFDASYYSDIQKKKKFLGITTGTSYSTQYTGADGALENQFALLLRQFNDAIIAAAGPLGATTDDIQSRLNGFVVNLGRIDLKGLTGEQIQEKLSAVFGAAADNMANAAFPGLTQFQKVGEGAFETLVRVASTIEAVGSSLDMLGKDAKGMSMAAKLGLVDQFESVSALTDAADAYFQAFYTQEEQTAARTAQLTRVFGDLGLTMPNTLSAFRQLVDAQDLATAAGQATYATLLQLAPAFADLQSSLAGAKSAADVASERADLQRQLLELQGNTAALRDLDLAKLDESNRALQMQIWAVNDAQEAAKAADELRKAWSSVGDSIMDEVRRIRGLDAAGDDGGFATLMGRFNATTAAARNGDMDAAKTLPQLSQALLTAAANAASSRQELSRVQAETAASLEATYGAIGKLGTDAAALSSAALLAAAGTTQAAKPAANDDAGVSLDDLRREMADTRRDLSAALAQIAGSTSRMASTMDGVTRGGDTIAVEIEVAA